ncbi:hypothetical protein BG000_006444 [Podila horticola]|nr:hypothetical protein BG000_006444 [Podila horticola]
MIATCGRIASESESRLFLAEMESAGMRPNYLLEDTREQRVILTPPDGLSLAEYLKRVRGQDSVAILGNEALNQNLEALATELSGHIDRANQSLIPVIDNIFRQ